MEVYAGVTFKSKNGPATCKMHLFDYDNDVRILEIAKSNVYYTGVYDLILFALRDVAELMKLDGFKTGHVIFNPSYGDRHGTISDLITLYTRLSVQLQTECKGSVISIYSGSYELLSCIKMQTKSKCKLHNGTLNCMLKTCQITAHRKAVITESHKMVAPEFLNRLRKNIKKFEKWAKKQDIECYRLYYADLPDYNVAIDRYKNYIIIQEYAAPRTISKKTARCRLLDIVRASIAVTGVNANNIILKKREKQKGANQYQKLSEAKRFMNVMEYGVKLEVNLQDYIDTGLFLDHRNIRKMLGEKAAGKKFLNLFAYTGAATVHAATGGAKSTTTVDMSKTYLAWAERNMQLNHKVGHQHQYIQTDCLKWLSMASGQYDLIFINPPTFSNSKRMEDTFDVQRDYLKVMVALKRLLRVNGEIVFSNNKRNFKIDLEKLNEIGLFAKNITKGLIPLDFERNKYINNCWLMTHMKVHDLSVL